MSDIIRANIQDEKLSVKVIERDDALWVELTDRVAGRTWDASPLLKLEVHDKRLRREERVEKYRVEELHVWDTGMHVTVLDKGFGVTVGLWLLLEKGELVVKFSIVEVYEAHPIMFGLFAVDVLPGLMRVAGAEGRILLPVNGGMICRPANKPAAADKFMIYLEQPRWELSTLVPVCAAWDERSGLVALATKAAPEAQCRVATDGKGAGLVGFAFSLRRIWPDPVEPGEREFRFLPIPPKTDPVHFAAKRLRRHVTEDLKKPTLKQRAEESPEVAYQLSSMTIKLFYGLQNRGPCITDPQGLPENCFRNAMTFDEAAGALRKLHAAGIPRLYTQSTGWNARGHDGLYPTRFPVEPRIGGEERFRELFKVSASLGYQASVHDNYQMNTPDAPDWDTDCVIQDPYGEPLVRGYWSAGVEYGSWPLAFPEKRSTGHMRRVKDLGVQGMGYFDYWMAPLEVNYHPKHRGTRSDHVRGMEKVLAEGKRVFGAISTEFGPLPALVACDEIAMTMVLGFHHAIRHYSHWPISQLVDEVVPLTVLTMHGLVMHQAAGGPTWNNILNAVTWGCKARDEWGMRDVKMGGVGVFSEARVPALKALHDICVERFGYLQAEEMTRCEMSTDMQHVRSTYADGTEVVTDFTKKELVVNGKRVEKPAALLEKHC